MNKNQICNWMENVFKVFFLLKCFKYLLPFLPPTPCLSEKADSEMQLFWDKKIIAFSYNFCGKNIIDNPM